MFALIAAASLPASTAPGGNSANAKLCQKGGWNDWERSDGTVFANQGECVRYVAQGGTLTPVTGPITGEPPSTDCSARGPGVNLSFCDFRGISLDGANLRGANLSGTNLTLTPRDDVNLRGADLSGAFIIRNDLRGADLTNANLTNARVGESNLFGADLTGVRWDVTICPDGSQSDSRTNNHTCIRHLIPG